MTDLELLIAQRIRQARESKKWSQNELARRSGIRQGVISRYEDTSNELSTPGFIHMIQLSKTLKKSLVWFTR